MEKLITKTSHTRSCPVLLALLLLTGGCSVETTEEGASEVTATTSQALGGSFTKNGFTVKWTKVGVPWAADKIGACGSTLWALNDDRSLWSNTSGGIDTGWTRRVSLSNAAKSIACTGSAVYYIDTAERLWRSYNNTTWTLLNNPSDAEHIASAGDEIYALNFDKRIYDGSSPYNGAWGGWSYRGTASSADRVTGGDSANGARHRAFALNLNNSLWYNDGLQGTGGTWYSLPNGDLALDEISAAKSTLLYGLTEGSRELWKAEFTEASCFDDVDNDNDGMFDAADVDCTSQVADYVCAHSGDGSYCFDRFFSENPYSLAVCSDGEVVDTDSGNLECVHKAGGKDVALHSPLGIGG